MKEYMVENGRVVDLALLTSPPLPLETYRPGHQGLPLLCHDAFIEYNGGILLVKRRNLPAKDVLWPLGGRVERGMPTETSLKKKIREESGLTLTDVTYLDCGRTFFQTDPFKHGHGTDTLNLVYFARGEGDLNLDKLHEEPTIVRPDEYHANYRHVLEEYVRDGMDKAIVFVRR